VINAETAALVIDIHYTQHRIAAWNHLGYQYMSAVVNLFRGGVS